MPRIRDYLPSPADRYTVLAAHSRRQYWMKSADVLCNKRTECFRRTAGPPCSCLAQSRSIAKEAGKHPKYAKGHACINLCLARAEA